MAKKLASRCPVCGGELAIARLTCSSCETQIDTSIDVPSFFRLPADLQHFVLVFLRCRGNIREVEKELGISYPTVCKRLDLVNGLLDNRVGRLSREQILGQLEKGEITAKQAAELLKGGRAS